MTGSLDHIPEPIEARRPGIGPYVLAGLAVVVLFFVGFGSWSAIAVLDSAALAPGVVTIESSRKTVQHSRVGSSASSWWPRVRGSTPANC